MAEEKRTVNGLTASELELNTLFKETLDGLRDDITEAQQNVEMYFDAILNETGGKENYGMLYNDSLKIKGLARERQLKFINMFKDRVSTKEKNKLAAEVRKEMQGGGGVGFTQADLNKFIEDHENTAQFIKNPVISKEEDDEDIDFEEIITDE